ncbi:MAG: CRISPR-associated protein Cas4 [Eubacterium sp.]|nr:CRISPR-associated protein Cas4 [Eubacterium sp.]MDY2595975.1 CRISPR-associated protein Cas4 [Oliverpabstia sp.]
MSTIEISIRSIQHYMYCSHRWGLLEIDKAWAENAFVTKANLMHNRVHDPERNYRSRGKKVYTSVPVYNDLDEYNLYGVTDCLEITEDKNGISIDGSQEKYNICIVEYKPTKPKNEEYHEEDLMQVFAQKICVDYVFGGNSEAVLYYADVKKRIKLPLKENFEVYNRQLIKLLEEMRINLEQGVIPPIRKGQKCNGCSMKDLCMPSVKKSKDFMSEIRKIQETEVSAF